MTKQGKKIMTKCIGVVDFFAFALQGGGGCFNAIGIDGNSTLSVLL